MGQCVWAPITQCGRQKMDDRTSQEMAVTYGSNWAIIKESLVRWRHGHKLTWAVWPKWLSNYHMTAVVQVQLVTCLDNQLMLRVVSDHLRFICINKKNSSFAEAWDLYWLQSLCRPENSRYDSWPGSSSLTKVKDGQLGNGVFRTSTHRRLPRALPSNRTRQ